MLKPPINSPLVLSSHFTKIITLLESITLKWTILEPRKKSSTKWNNTLKRKAAVVHMKNILTWTHLNLAWPIRMGIISIRAIALKPRNLTWKCVICLLTWKRERSITIITWATKKLQSYSDFPIYSTNELSWKWYTTYYKNI